MRAFPSQKRKQGSSSLELEELTSEQLVERFADHLRHQQDSLSELVRPLDRSLIRLLKSKLSSNRKDDLDSLVQRQLGENRTLADFLSNYFTYIMLVQFEDEPAVINPGFHHYQKQTDPIIDHDNNFDLLLNAYNPASNIFRRPDAAYFTRSIQHLSHGLVYFAIKADRKKRSTKKEKASEAARQMTTTLGVACIDRLILTYLIVASLPLGILPRPILLEQFQLQNEFHEVVGSLRTGNWPGVVNGLEKNRDWFRYKGIYILLREKLEVICWRNFFVIMAGLKNGNPGMRLSLTQSVEAARKVFMEPSIDEDDIVCMASSLIDQGYLRAYIKLGEMIVFGSVLPQISTVGEHMNEGGPEPLPAFSGKAIPMSIQPSSDSDAPVKSYRRPYSIRGAKKISHTKRFA
ncbi:hypothetical protein PGTUg99_008052 [Puccinia graminis f. sp. tritici]|uniref:PCI domain-containing protein n=1 Tax=Puccinia graminis f. sp. tritici TaxID=56615 RepID=A0A5B0SEN8_PUCGR|nr:hypothetical protein PGTUg99_008052 [Puccinia graminis f. sp. tritici]